MSTIPGDEHRPPQEEAWGPEVGDDRFLELVEETVEALHVGGEVDCRGLDALVDGYVLPCPRHLSELSYGGLGLRDCVRRLGIQSTTCPSSEIITHCEAGNYAEIIEHVTEDILTTEKLFNYLTQAAYTQ